MSGPFKPGTVLRGVLDGNEVVGIMRGGTQVYYADSVTSDCVDIKHLSGVRPLVVLDPSPLTPRGLLDHMGRLIDEGMHLEKMSPHIAEARLSVRELMRQVEAQFPPKPPEPSHIGAVVRDSNGRRWVRGSGQNGYFCWTEEILPGIREEYAAIDAVEVLSKGFAP